MDKMQNGVDMHGNKMRNRVDMGMTRVNFVCDQSEHLFTFNYGVEGSFFFQLLN